MTSAIRVFLVLTILGVLAVASTEAGPISLMNPYRSYNLSGINYGSEQWEKDHARSQMRAATPAPPPQQMNRVVHRRRRHR
jgi:hypothetical protein